MMHKKIVILFVFFMPYFSIVNSHAQSEIVVVTAKLIETFQSIDQAADMLRKAGAFAPARYVEEKHYVIFYRLSYGGGQAIPFRKNERVPKLRKKHYRINDLQWGNWSNEASSIKVRAGAILIGYEKDNYGGLRLVVAGGEQGYYIEDLHKIVFNDHRGRAQSWDNRISSLIVVENNEQLFKNAFP